MTFRARSKDRSFRGGKREQNIREQSKVKVCGALEAKKVMKGTYCESRSKKKRPFRD